MKCIFSFFIRGFANCQSRLYISIVGILHKKSANPNMDCAFLIILFNILYILSRLGLSLSRHQVHDTAVLL